MIEVDVIHRPLQMNPNHFVVVTVRDRQHVGCLSFTCDELNNFTALSFDPVNSDKGALYVVDGYCVSSILDPLLGRMGSLALSNAGLVAGDTL